MKLSKMSFILKKVNEYVIIKNNHINKVHFPHQKDEEKRLSFIDL